MGTAEDENGHEFEQTPGDGERQAYCNPCSSEDSDMT